jgi:hypothetical protein
MSNKIQSARDTQSNVPNKIEATLQLDPIEFEPALSQVSSPSPVSRKQVFDWQQRNTERDQEHPTQPSKQDISSNPAISKQTDSLFSRAMNRSANEASTFSVLSQLAPSTSTPLKWSAQSKEDVRLEKLVPRSKTKQDAGKAEVSEYAAPGNIKQYIPLNSDNDNNSPMVLFTPTGGGQGVPQHIPQTYDFQTSNYGNDDDLIPLNIQWTNVPPDMAILGYQSYAIVLTSNAPEGDISGIKLWKDAAKTVQLPVNVGYTTTGMNIWPGKGYGTLPGFYLEGVKVGKQLDEFSITVLTKVVSNGIIVLTSKEVDVTATPVIKSFTVTKAEDPAHRTKMINNVEHHFFTPLVEWKAEIYVATYDFMTTSTIFQPQFVQHLKSDIDLLPGQFAVFEVDQPNNINWGRKHTKNPNALGPNKDYWYLDSGTGIDPYYEHTMVDSGNLNLYIMTGRGTPGIEIDADVWKVKYKSEYKTELVWASHEYWSASNANDIIYPLAYFDWDVTYDDNGIGFGPENKTNKTGITFSNQVWAPYVPSYAVNDDGHGGEYLKRVRR